MRGLWLEDGRVRVRRDLPEPVPGRGEALVRVSLAGICGTDLALVRGYRPFVGVPGHEFVGRVERGPEAWRGRRVTAEINVTCESGVPAAIARESGAPGRIAGPDADAAPCPACEAGRAAHCERRSVIGIAGRDGAFAELVVAPAANLHALPDEVDDQRGVFVEPLAAAFRILEQVHIGPGDRVLVVGPGRLGQLVARALGAADIPVEVAGRSPATLERLSGQGVVTHSIEGVTARAYDVAVDCTGQPEGFEIARRAVRPGGTLVLKSTYAGPGEIDASALVVDEIRVVGSRCGPFPIAIDALASRTVEVADLVEARYPLEEAAAAFDRAARSGAGKVLLAPAAAT